MLTHLQLRDLAIVDHVEMEFTPGLTALTGETGAGKSIIVDALLLASGARAAIDVVRHGAERAEVAASFNLAPGAASRWLQEQSIDHQGEVILRRVIGADGRSRAYINGQLVAVQALREFADLLIEIHGQQEFQHLIRREAQRELLDEHSVPPALRAAVAQAFDAYQECRRDFDRLKSSAENREARLDFLEFQARELGSEITTVEELEQTLLAQKRVANRSRLAEAAQTALHAITENESQSARDLLARAASAIRPHADSDTELRKARELLEEAQLIAGEAAGILRDYIESLDADPARQEELERRVATLESLARKHRVPVLELPAQLIRVETELRDLRDSSSALSDREAQLNQLIKQYQDAAAALSAARRPAAADLSAQIAALMQSLGMAGGRFAIQLSSAPSNFSVHGADEVDFLVSANPGQPLKPLARVASGGELSRISLAIQVAAAARNSPLCMVFDEVDAGVGGAVAEIVGKQLRELGTRAQVLCVTHLPQVASQAHRQFRVTKLTDGKTTRTTLSALNEHERVEEIARMLGGVDVTDKAREHAREMLAAGSAQTAKKQRARRATI